MLYAGGDRCFLTTTAGSTTWACFPPDTAGSSELLGWVGLKGLFLLPSKSLATGLVSLTLSMTVPNLIMPETDC